MRKSPIWRGDQGFSLFLRRAAIAAVGYVSLLLPRASTAQDPQARADSSVSSRAQTPTSSVPQSEVPGANGPNSQGASKLGFDALVQSQIQRLQTELERTRALVENGTLARNQLKKVEDQLADAKDQGILAETLYSAESVDKMTAAQSGAMMEAAQRRIARQEMQTEERQRLLDTGAISQSEFDSVSAELEERKRVLTLAENRVRLLTDLRRMAETEKIAEKVAATSAPTLGNSMVRYGGNGMFSLTDIPTINAQFERRFHHPLPVSALGQTLLHQSLGLDHRNRVDVAINPASDEGVWLRNLLEKLHVPYLAFSSAVAGAATAPHIHIGMESTRLKSGFGS